MLRDEGLRAVHDRELAQSQQHEALTYQDEISLEEMILGEYETGDDVTVCVATGKCVYVCMMRWKHSSSLNVYLLFYPLCSFMYFLEASDDMSLPPCFKAFLLTLTDVVVGTYFYSQRETSWHCRLPSFSLASKCCPIYNTWMFHTYEV